MKRFEWQSENGENGIVSDREIQPKTTFNKHFG